MEMRAPIEPRDQYYTPTVDITEIRRGSNASVSTYYSSMQSDGSTLSAHPSRRVSEASLPYDPITTGSSRRSSEPSLAPTLSGYQQKIQMRQRLQHNNLVNQVASAS